MCDDKKTRREEREKEDQLDAFRFFRVWSRRRQRRRESSHDRFTSSKRGKRSCVSSSALSDELGREKRKRESEGREGERKKVESVLTIVSERRRLDKLGEQYRIV